MVLKKHTTPLKVPSSIAVKTYNLIITFELSHLYDREVDITCMKSWIKIQSQFCLVEIKIFQLKLS